MSPLTLVRASDERYLSKRDVAERLGFSVRSVERMIAERGLPSKLIGGQRRLLWSEVVAWVDHQQRPEGR